MVALIIGILKQKDRARKVLDALKIRNMHPVPTAWDYIFSKQEPSWVIVTLIDNRLIMGLYSKNSFASSDSEERDIYIEKIFDVDENNQWIENIRNKGILISKDQVKTIEYQPSKEERGYQPTGFQDGHKPATGISTQPPNTGSSVQPAPPEKK